MNRVVSAVIPLPHARRGGCAAHPGPAVVAPDPRDVAGLGELAAASRGMAAILQGRGRRVSNHHSHRGRTPALATDDAVGWTPGLPSCPVPGVTHEQRIWEQLSATIPEAASCMLSLRVRLEQRFQDNWDGSSHRLRLMGRGVRPLDAGRRWNIAAWNGTIAHSHDMEVGPTRGRRSESTVRRGAAGSLRRRSDSRPATCG